MESYSAMEITTKIGCAVNCLYCPQSLLMKQYYANDRDRPEYMTFEVFCKCIDKIPPEVDIDFSGMCESYFNLDCTRMITYASEKGHNIKIFTTLLGAKKEDIEAWESIPNITRITLHIPDNENHSVITINDNYLRNINIALNTKCKAEKSLSCHGTVHNQLKNIINDHWKLNNAELIDRAGNIDKGLKHYQKNKPVVCSISGENLNYNVLLPDGTVLLCCMDYGLKHVLGNLTKDSYVDLFVGQEMCTLKNGLNDQSSDILCRNCSKSVTFQELIQTYFQMNHFLQEQETAKVWLEQQYLNYKYDNDKKEKQIQELQHWAEEQETAKKWLKEQYINYKAESERKDRIINDLLNGAKNG